MQINLSGHHVEITDGIRTHVKSKLDKIASHYPGIIAMTVILGNEHNKFTCEINTSYGGAPISATGNDENLFSAIAVTGKKVDAALSHRKGVLKANQHDKPSLEDPQADSEVFVDVHAEVDIDAEFEKAS
ncbi:MAG: ribosome-associated translation inhibitor RaiA [Psychrosphaera sp.]|nr:ribosome-associated translation inhibitor RaiA [Psychrosphaera sp.]NQZ09486.1 ribosome-associated translation inhibitor RaiA [Algicola sp.]